MIKVLVKNDLTYCIRLGVNNSNFAKQAMDDERTDYVTNWYPSNKERENCRKHELNDRQPVKVRVVKVKLKTGETELLVTDLYDSNSFTQNDLEKLYALRWGVEEGFKNLKPKMKIEHFGCKKVDGIFQEFYAHIFQINMIGIVGMCTVKDIEVNTKHRKLEYTFNWKNAYRFIREKTISFIFNKKMNQTIEYLIINVSNSLTAIKPDRSFTRDVRNLHKKGSITHFNK